MAYLIGLLISGVIFGMVTKYIANSKGYEGGFAWGFWLGLIGVLVVGFRPDQVQTQESYQSRYGSDNYRMAPSKDVSGYAPRSVKGWICICGSRNPSSIDYCMSCRRSREEATEERIKCIHCGASNKKSNELCFACGKPVTEIDVIEAHSEQQVEEKQKEKVDFTETLEKLAKLHEQGILTDDEFTRKKTEILNKM